jgi:predicted metal-binding protein
MGSKVKAGVHIAMLNLPASCLSCNKCPSAEAGCLMRAIVAIVAIVSSKTVMLDAEYL